MKVRQTYEPYGNGRAFNRDADIRRKTVFQSRGKAGVGNDKLGGGHSLDMVAQGLLPVIQIMVSDGHYIIPQLVHQDGKGFSPFFTVVHIGITYEIIT